MNEEKLKAAAGELEAALLSELPTADGGDHEFSDSFNRKMKKTIFRAKHPIVGNGWRRAVAAMLAIALLGGSALIAIPKARASFVGWVKEAYGTAIHFFIPDKSTVDVPKDVPTAYHLGWAPEGYTLLDILESATNVSYIYVNAEGLLLYFDYIIPKNGSGPDSFLEVKDHTHKVVSVGDLQADLYINNKKGSNGLIWTDKSGTVLFCIMGTLDAKVLLKLAESILPGKLDTPA
jgi:hypothetical protein